MRGNLALSRAINRRPLASALALHIPAVKWHFHLTIFFAPPEKAL
jgi:hypothetical protein